MTLKLTSKSFSDYGEMPSRHTCEGKNVSPPLEWINTPDGTKSYVLIVDDPDAPDPRAPRITWVHWVLYDLPAGTSRLCEDVAAQRLPDCARQGMNDWKRVGYGGPCPPVGQHRYFHKLYALDVMLGDLGHPTKAQLEKAIAGHVLAYAELVGTYEKQL